jgi:hypothetical protein
MNTDLGVRFSGVPSRPYGWLLLFVGLSSLAWFSGVVDFIESGHLRIADVRWYFFPVSILAILKGISGIRQVKQLGWFKQRDSRQDP